jgi:CheY-like chemotaxis protein
MQSATVFILEDEALIRMMLAEMVEELGHVVVAETGDVQQGCSLAEVLDFDLAILDINLDGSSSEPVASIVRARGLPLFFISGYGPDGVPDAFRGTPVLRKPCTAKELGEMIERVRSTRG